MASPLPLPSQSPPVDSATRTRVLRVIVISLLLDLISFTFILPLFPKLLEFYRDHDTSYVGGTSILRIVLSYLNKYKASFARPIDARYDIVLLGGAMGSLFSILQAIASPLIGKLSDRYGRRKALLASMIGNLLSVFLWVVAADFGTFLASRVVGGLSEGNVQLALAMATDVSDERNRSSTMALIGACFSIAFTVGPALGAWLSSIPTVAANPFATAAGFSFLLIVIETVYLYIALPETLPALAESATRSSADSASNARSTKADVDLASSTHSQRTDRSTTAGGTNSLALLNAVHFGFLLLFSGMESSLSFMTYDLFAFSSSSNGRLLGFIGLVASILQGGVTRRLAPLRSIHLGVVACLAAFGLLARLSSVTTLYLAAGCLAVTSATVVTGLNALASFEAGHAVRGARLGVMRSWGQLGRALGPLLFTSVYWWAGREAAYGLGAAGIAAILGIVATRLKTPPGTSGPAAKGAVTITR